MLRRIVFIVLIVCRWADRVPAWIKWATVEPGRMGAHYDGVHWDPPEGEKYTWCVLPNCTAERYC